MFDFQGFPSLKSVYWRDLRPGMVFVGGVKIDGGLPPELGGFPLITAGLRNLLEKKYQFLRNRSVLVYEPTLGSLSAADLSDRLCSAASRVDTLNGMRGELLARRVELVGAEDAGREALCGPLVRQDSLILDHWASGIRSYDSPGRRPSLLGDIKASLTLAEILTGALAGKLSLPDVGEFQLHIAVDASYSMKASGRDGIVRDVLGFFHRWLVKVFPKAAIHWLAFSDSCAPLSPPFQRIPVARGETRYETFVRKVLHDHRRDVRTTVLVFTDGVPSDRAAAADHLARFGRLGIDYTQIVFRIAEEGYGESPEGTKVLDGYRLNEADPVVQYPRERQGVEAERIRREFSDLAVRAGGNQIILTLDRALGVIAVEAFDRWLGAASAN